MRFFIRFLLSIAGGGPSCGRSMAAPAPRGGSMGIEDRFAEVNGPRLHYLVAGAAIR